MSLSAITQNRQVFNPSSKIEIGFDRKNIQLSYRAKAKEGSLFCPHCFVEGNLEPVLFRSGGESKRDHFFHASSSSKCSYSPMTEKHINAQSWVADSLQKKYPDAKITFEFRIKSQEGSSRPDICAEMPDGSLRAFEIQISKITEYEVKIRTKKLLEFGCKDVTWFFTSHSSSDLIKNQLAIMSQNHMILTFNEDNSVHSTSKTDLIAVKKDLIQSFRSDAKIKPPKQPNKWIYYFIFYLNIDWFLFLVYANTQLKKEIDTTVAKASRSENKAMQTKWEKALRTSVGKAYRHSINGKIYIGIDNHPSNILGMLWVADAEEDKIKTIPFALLVEV
jgi:hypothetical protein